MHSKYSLCHLGNGHYYHYWIFWLPWKNIPSYTQPNTHTHPNTNTRPSSWLMPSSSNPVPIVLWLCRFWDLGAAFRAGGGERKCWSHVLAGVIMGRVEVLRPKVSPRRAYIRDFPLGQGCLDLSHPQATKLFCILRSMIAVRSRRHQRRSIYQAEGSASRSPHQPRPYQQILLLPTDSKVKP